MYNYERLIFFVRAKGVVKVVSDLTLTFPKFEIYELGNQMRRAADSIVFNTAEGSSKKSVADMSSYLRHALGSCQELKVQVERAFDKGYLNFEDRVNVVRELNEIGKMINGFIKKLRD